MCSPPNKHWPLGGFHVWWWINRCHWDPGKGSIPMCMYNHACITCITYIYIHCANMCVYTLYIYLYTDITSWYICGCNRVGYSLKCSHIFPFVAVLPGFSRRWLSPGAPCHPLRSRTRCSGSCTHKPCLG